jgi:uncharacterized membrane protein
MVINNKHKSRNTELRFAGRRRIMLYRNQFHINIKDIWAEYTILLLKLSQSLALFAATRKKLSFSFDTMRKKAAKLSKQQNILWRSHEPSRLETFSDAVFAFAVTLLMISIEVPHTFNELFEVFKGVLSFVACFAILFIIWNGQNLFFRRYGINDSYTTFLNAALLFVVLIYVYPLKFLFVAWLGGGDNTTMQNGHLVPVITEQQLPTLMYLYHAGYFAVYLLFLLMYSYARKKAHEINLTPAEIFETDSLIIINMVNCALAAVAALVVLLVKPENSGSSGMVYVSIPIVYTVLFSVRGKMRRKKFGEIERNEPA